MAEKYRVYARLDAENAEHVRIIEKVEHRNKILHPSVNDYVLHALENFEEDKNAVLVEQIRKVIKEELSCIERENVRFSLLSEMERESKGGLEK